MSTHPHKTLIADSDKTLRKLAAREYEHPVVSAFLNLDPERFGTAPARETEITALLDTGGRQLDATDLTREDRMALGEDLDRIGRQLREELNPSGAGSVALYASSRDGLWEVEPLRSTTPTGVSIGPLPELEPLLPTPEPELICVALVNRRHAQLFSRHRGGELEELDLTDRVHGQIRQGGMAQRRYQRTIELQVDEHLRRVAAVLYELWRERDFDRLVLGGPHEAVCRLRAQLHADLSPLLDDHELTTDMSDDSPPKVEADLTPLRDSWRRDAERQALSELTSGQEPATALGPADTLAAANQKLVRTLVLAPDADSRANVCPNCSQLYGETEGACPADGETLVPLPSMRNALIRATVRDGGDVLVLHTSDPSAFSGIGALLRA